MGFPATESSVSQIIEKLDSLPNSARDTAVNNSIVLSDNLGGFGESVLKLYSEIRVKTIITTSYATGCHYGHPFVFLCVWACSPAFV